MTIKLEQKTPDAMAQTVRIGPHQFLSDASVAEGSLDAGPNPHDLYDAALGACKALTVLWYARKKGMAVTDVKTVVERDASSERAGVYRLAARLQVAGDISDAQLSELAAVAAKCPVHKLMTLVTTEITTELERMQ
ncbi:MAG: OsmC family protein [Polaromonas sp.]|nr:OsmC family protein [Polaromonas sp.]